MSLDLSTLTAAAHAPELLALALRSPDKRTRQHARSLLEGAPKVGAFVAGQKSAHRASSPQRLWKLIRTVSRSGCGIDMVRFCGAVAGIAAQGEDQLVLSDILAAALRLKQPPRPFFAAMPPIALLTLDDIRGALPDGLDTMTGTVEVTLRGTALSRPDHIDQLGGLPKLTALRSWLPVSDLRLYDPLSHMTKLDFGGAQSRLDDISALAGWQGLEFLNLGDTKVADIAPLAGKDALSYLNLASTQVADIAPLAGLPALKQLNLTRLKGTDLSTLTTLPSLTWLALDFVKVRDLSVLSGCVRLESLRLWGNTVDSLAPLAALPLVRLEILYSPTPDLSALSASQTLRSLRLVHTQTDPADLDALRAALPELTIST